MRERKIEKRERETMRERKIERRERQERKKDRGRERQ